MVATKTTTLANMRCAYSGPPAGGRCCCDSAHIAATETPFPEKKIGGAAQSRVVLPVKLRRFDLCQGVARRFASLKPISLWESSCQSDSLSVLIASHMVNRVTCWSLGFSSRHS